MSDNKKTDSPSTKEAANTKLPSSPATFEDTYPTVSESRLRDSPEQITHKDYHEDFVVVSTTATPAPGELETNGKAYGSVGSVGVEGVEGGLSMRNEAARKGMVTEEDCVFVGGTEKEKKEVKGKKEEKGENKEGGKKG